MRLERQAEANSPSTGRLNQYRETNVMHFLSSLLRIKGLYMFRALLAHPQQALHKQHLIYCVRVLSVELQSWCSQLIQHALNIQNGACVAPTEDEQVMLETFKR
jgi:hypothetical protein